MSFTTIATPRAEGLAAHGTALDCVRGIAILLVVIFHYFIVQSFKDPNAPWFITVLSWTWGGVDLFFVLSGFLIGANLLANQGASNLVSVFYSRRLLRIVPLYILFMGGYIALEPFLVALQTEPALQLLERPGQAPLWEYALFFQNFRIVANGKWPGLWFGPTWSLAVEMHFYLVAPLIVRCVPARRLVAVLVGLMLAAVAVRNVCLASNVGLGAYVLMPSRCDAFAIGMLVAVAWHDRHASAWLRANHQLLVRGLVFGCGLMLVLAMPGYAIWAGFDPYALGLTCLAFVSANLLLVAIYAPNASIRALFACPWLAAVGARAYGIYLLHLPMLGLANIICESLLRIDPPYVWVQGLALVLTWVCADIALRCIERPFIAMGKRMRYQHRQQAFVAAAS